MIYLNHDFKGNYLNALRSNDFELAIKILVNEISAIIANDTSEVISMLQKSGITIKNPDSHSISELLCKEIVKNKIVKNNLVILICRKTNISKYNDYDYTDKIKRGIDAIVGSSLESGSENKCNQIKNLVKNLKNRENKMISSNGDNQSQEENKGIVLNKSVVMKYVTYALAIYGGYQLFKIYIMPAMVNLMNQNGQNNQRLATGGGIGMGTTQPIPTNPIQQQPAGVQTGLQPQVQPTPQVQL